MGVILVAGAIGVSIWQSDSPRENSQDKFTREFTGSYARAAEHAGNTVEVTLRASATSVEIIDGVQTHVWAYNDRVPGPDIRIALGDTLRVTLANDLNQPTTIHWHGVRVPNAMDGVPGVTQSAVGPGDTFVYEFTPPDAGTFWFHPHVRGSEQVEHGLYGTLVVEDEYADQYSQDIVWVLDDWLLQEDGQLYPQFNTRHDLVHDGRWGNVITVNGSPSEEFRAAPGERIRLRLVNASNGRVYTPDFGSLNASIIAVDGMLVGAAFAPGDFELAPGNRIDIDITVPEVGTYPIVDRFAGRYNPLGSIRADGSAVTTPDFAIPLAAHMPAWQGAADSTPDLVYELDARVGGPYGVSWTLNNEAFPDSTERRLELDTFQVVRFDNASTRLHPMHLHGQFFKVIVRNGNPVDEPYWRDTVLVNPQETIDVALVPTEEGSWALHCHVLEHAEAGMMTTVNVS